MFYREKSMWGETLRFKNNNNKKALLNILIGLFKLNKLNCVFAMLVVIQSHQKENIKKSTKRVLETMFWRTESPKLSETIIGTGKSCFLKTGKT